MKQVINISAVFIGLVIGAGFASGKEIFEYFSIPSTTDCTGIVIATISFAAICYIIMQLAQKHQCSDFDSLLRILSGRLSPIVRFFMLTYMFCGFFIMLSACGVLARETFGLSPQSGIWLLALVCFCVFAFDIKGLVAINTILVPLMVAGIVFICFASLFQPVPVFSSFNTIKTNPLISSLCYVSYNTITAGAVLVPLSMTANKKQLIGASAISGCILGLLIFVIWLTMNTFFESLISADMPLLTLSTGRGTITTYIYTAVLFMALCTTAVSQGFGILSKFNFTKSSHRVFAAAILCMLAIPFAGFGFSALVSNLYSAFGYAGLLWTGVIIWKFVN